MMSNQTKFNQFIEIDVRTKSKDTFYEAKGDGKEWIDIQKNLQ